MLVLGYAIDDADLLVENVGYLCTHMLWCFSAFIPTTQYP